jgi:hypothetical protein
MFVSLAGSWRRFQDYEPLGFGERGNGSAPLMDVGQLMARRTSLCLYPQNGGTFKIVSH